MREEVSDDKTMAIPNVVLTPWNGKTHTKVITVAKIGLYEIGKQLQDWCSEVTQILKEKRDT